MFTPFAPHSFASRRVMPAIPDLLAVYEGTRMPPWNDSIDAMLMILPPPFAMKCLPAAWHMKNADLMFTFITSSQSCSLKSTASARRIRPALLTRMSRRPKTGDRVSSTMRTNRLDRDQVGLDVDEAAAERAHLRGGLLGRHDAGDRDIRTRLGKRQRDALAQAGVAAGDQRDLAGQIEQCVAHARLT